MMDSVGLIVDVSIRLHKIECRLAGNNVKLLQQYGSGNAIKPGILPVQAALDDRKAFARLSLHCRTSGISRAGD
jgi:hypothetical protein